MLPTTLRPTLNAQPPKLASHPTVLATPASATTSPRYYCCRRSRPAIQIALCGGSRGTAALASLKSVAGGGQAWAAAGSPRSGRGGS
jgi:hypothetical protein